MKIKMKITVHGTEHFQTIYGIVLLKAVLSYNFYSVWSMVNASYNSNGNNNINFTS